MASPRLLVVFTLAAVVMVGAVAGLALDSWWVLVALLVLHGIISTTVILAIGQRTGQKTKPDPVTEAQLAEKGKDMETEEGDEVDTKPGREPGDDDDRAFAI